MLAAKESWAGALPAPRRQVHARARPTAAASTPVGTTFVKENGVEVTYSTKRRKQMAPTVKYIATEKEEIRGRFGAELETRGDKAKTAAQHRVIATPIPAQTAPGSAA